MRRIGIPIVALALAAPVRAQAVHNVSSGTLQSFATIQQAVDQAADGDALLVAAGTYEPFLVQGKSLAIFAVPGHSVVVAPAVGSSSAVPIRIDAIGPQQRVVLSGVSATDGAGFPLQLQVPLRVTNSAGSVFFQDGSFIAFELPWHDVSCSSSSGADGAQLLDSHRVTFTDCQIAGGAGSYTDDVCVSQGASSGPGGEALVCTGSSVALYGCTLNGGLGGGAPAQNSGALWGGGALALTGSTAFASGTSFVGGAGGNDGFVTASGGVGAFIAAGSELRRLDCVVVGGSGQRNGMAITGQGLDIQLSGIARGLAFQSVAWWGRPGSATFQGATGDVVWHLPALATQFQPLPQGGVLHVVPPLPFPQPEGVVTSPSGLTTRLDFTSLSPTPITAAVAVQGFAVTANGRRRLSNVRHQLAIDPTSGPDCNANGINDYVDLLAGFSSDVDGNLIPDECP